MFCPECGKTVEEGTVFCPDCGTRVGDSKKLAIMSKKKRPYEKGVKGKIYRTRLTISGLFLVGAITAVWFLAGCVEKPLKYSTIHEAAEKGDLEDVKNHLRRGTAVNAKDYYGLTPLFYAVKRDQIKVANFLIKKGAEVNAEVSQWGERVTPLETASANGFKDMVELLIRKGADIKKYGTNAVDLAIKGFEMFKGHKEDFPPEMLTKVDFFGTAKLLIKKGTKPGDYTLHFAVKEGEVEIVKLLIDGGANVNAKGERGYTPLHMVVYEGKLEIAKFLIEKGADINAKDNYGYTPLKHAIGISQDTWRFDSTRRAKAKELADFLRKHGAKE